MEARMKRYRVAVIFLAAVCSLPACTSQREEGSPTGSPSADPSEEGSIVFNRSTAGKDLAVFTINLDGTEEQRIRPVGDGAILSPDGTRLMDPIPADDGRLTTSVFDIDGS
jgi:hypothetical protein